MDNKKELINSYVKGQNPWVDIGIQLGADCLTTVLEILDWHIEDSGRRIYVPKQTSFWDDLEKSVIREEVCAKFNGSNKHEIMLEYGLTERDFKRCWSRGARLRDRNGQGIRPKSKRANHAR